MVGLDDEDKAYQMALQQNFERISWLFLPGEIVDFYPVLKELIAKKEKTCMFSGAPISNGQLYINYHFFAISSNKFIISKPIYLETDHSFLYTLQGVENLQNAVNNSYGNDYTLDDLGASEFGVYGGFYTKTYNRR